MTYKAFQDWYREGNIKHLLLYNHHGCLISPPFATELCPEYNKIMKYDGSVSYIDTELPPAVSKTNCVVSVDNSSWFIPYGIYENNYNTVLQLTKDFVPIINFIEAEGKGQFYSGASNSTEAFSFPLGYEGTQYAMYIKDDVPKLIPFNHTVAKAHMGTVYCNGKFYSMPRGDEPGYTNLVSFDGNEFKSYDIPVNRDITRKYTDLIVKGNSLYSLPYGEQQGLNEVVEFNTDTSTISLHKLNVPDFAKKYNSMVLNGNHIIGLPYGDEHCEDSNYGIVFNTITKESKCFDIGITHGGKYRYRSGIQYYNLSVFFPGGTPSCPIIAVNTNGQIVYKKHYPNLMFGRPIIYNRMIHVIAYDIHTEKHYMYMFDESWTVKVIEL
jgi:hypothetical protein